ncbi:MAG TPA: 4-hydroxy-tetrahydrodipicolinate reductase [Woeseiaceae bacterium]|nr:4-hydroxy-tetrahydrodipicolinate reductase [Woeseiaceae bacterium]
MLRIAVLGAGRMGREVMRAIASCDELELAGVWVHGETRLAADLLAAHPGATVSDDPGEVLAAADIAVDFTLPAATLEVLDAALAAGRPLVCGVTGLEDAEFRRMRAVSRSLPLFYDRNMSLGIAVLKDLVSRAAPLLGPAFVAEIEDAHHVHKKDAPSGTAIALGEALAGSRGSKFADVFRYEPGSVAVRRTPDDIVFSVIREGEVAGEHSVIFRSGVERLELTHKVSDRRVFAQGALRAARWLAAQEPGLYCMQDLLEDEFCTE